MINLHIESDNIVWGSALGLLLDWLLKHQSKRLLVFLSGGSVVALYKDIARYIRTNRYVWDKLAFAQVDERFRPENSKHITFNIEQKTENRAQNKDINATVIGLTGLWEACEEFGIPYYLISQEGILEKAAEEYNQTISKLFKQYDYRIAILGIGADGHTAGLLPGYEKDWNIDSPVVGYENRGEFPRRITLTPKALKALDYALVVAVGENKRVAIENAVNKSNFDKLNSCPAVLINQIKQVDLFTDQILQSSK